MTTFSCRATLCALALAVFSGTASAQYEPDADTAALYHFDIQTAEGTTPDSGPNGLDGTLAGAVLPAHVQATVGGYGYAYQFDGVDRGSNNGRIEMGTDPALRLRGNGDFTLDVLVTVTSTLADDGYFRGIVCRAGGEGIDYSLSYSSWTNPTAGPEHEFWFTTGPVSGQAPEYSYAATAFAGLMEVGASYAIRVTVSAGVMTMTVNGVEGASTYYPPQSGAISPTATPITADFTVGDTCPEDWVIRPSELQVDELRISSVARTDLPLITGLGGLVPLDLGLGSAPEAFRAYRAARADGLVTLPAGPTPLP